MPTLTSLLGPGDWKWREYTADGSFIVPEGVYVVFLFLQSGGGGGGVSGANLVDQAVGGNGGDAVVGLPVLVSPGDTLVVDVGAGGFGATGATGTGGAWGGTGGNTTVTLPSGRFIRAYRGVRGRPGSSTHLDQGTPVLSWYIPGGTGGVGNDDGDDVACGGRGGVKAGVTKFAGGGGASFFGEGLNAGHDETATTPEVWSASLHGYGGGGGSYGEYYIEADDAAGAGADGIAWIAWEGPDYGA